jgi:MFS family permease
MVLAGFPAVASSAAGNGLVQSLTPDAFRGRVFGALEAIYGVSTLLGLALGGLAVDRVGVVPVFSVGASMWIAGGVVALVRLSPTLDAPSTRAQHPANA